MRQQTNALLDCEWNECDVGYRLIVGVGGDADVTKQERAEQTSQLGPLNNTMGRFCQRPTPRLS